MAKVPFRAKKVVRVLTIISIEVFLLIVAKKGYDLILMILSQESAALRIPMIYVYVAVPVGCILLFIEFLYAMIKGPKDGEYTPFATGGEF